MNKINVPTCNCSQWVCVISCITIYIEVPLFQLPYTVELRSFELEATVKICSSYWKFETTRSRNLREKKSGSHPGQFHYAMITDAK